MFNPLNFISKFVKSSNQKELDRIGKIVRQINLLEENIKKLEDEESPKKTNELNNLFFDVAQTFLQVKETKYIVFC